jgi:hypothetical protein
LLSRAKERSGRESGREGEIERVTSEEDVVVRPGGGGLRETGGLRDGEERRREMSSKNQ